MSELYKELHEELTFLKGLKEAPEWLTVEGWGTLKTGYLQPDETPRGMWQRVANAAASYYDNIESPAAHMRSDYLRGRFFDLFWKGWLGGATPVLGNMGTSNGFPISCFSSYMGDNRESIFSTFKEIAWMSSMGGGTAVYVGDIRERGAKIANGGISSGIVPWIKVLDSETVAVNQASFRRGSLAAYTHIEHPDYWDFIKIRQPHGDPNLQCTNIHQGVVVTDEFMNRLASGDEDAGDRWTKLLELRRQTGEPYILFVDTVNRANPEGYKALGLDVKASNLCIEMTLHTSELYSLVCCLSSLNAAKYDEWKHDHRVVHDSVMLLDAVMEEFIQKADGHPGFERAISFAKASRALGLGVMGYHTYLMDNGIPFESDGARAFNAELFSRIHRDSWEESRALAQLLGEPEWCKGFGVRNTHLSAVAPTKSNSTICGNVTEGIEPLIANHFTKDSKGAYPQVNQALAKVLERLGHNDEKTWDSIKKHKGSVQHLKFLSDHQKKVFKTALEIDQLEIVYQASDRQQFIDQSQSLNLFFPKDTDQEYINMVHIAAWQLGVKSLYYQKGEPKQTASSSIDYSAMAKPVEPVEQQEEQGFCPINKNDGETCLSCQ